MGMSNNRYPAENHHTIPGKIRQALVNMETVCYTSRRFIISFPIMKPDIHPPYYEPATIVCATCGSTMITGSTVKEMRVEICSRCHPFYTGVQHLVDTAGRVERFKRIVSRRTTTRPRRTKKKVAQ